MTEPEHPNARIAAFFETTQPDLPDRAFDAIGRDIHGTRQLIVIGPFREPSAFLRARYGLAAAVVLAIGIVLLNLRPVVGPGGAATPAPAPSPTIASSPTAVPTDVRATPATSPSGPSPFTSPEYKYTLTVPAGWVSAPALLPWDGVNQVGPYVESDKFVGPAQLSAWAFAGPFDGDLADFAADRIAANARDHADTCPPDAFEFNDPVEIAGQAWAILGWNCGALINQAITIHAGVAYAFIFRDLGVRASTDPVDRPLFLSILDSVELPK